MGKFSIAPYYIDSRSGFSEGQKNYVNSLLKSTYNKLQSRAIQRQETKEKEFASVYFTNKNNSIYSSNISTNSDLVIIDIDFFLSNLTEGKEYELAVINNFEYNSLIINGVVANSLSYKWEDFMSFRTEAVGDYIFIYVTRTYDAFPYKDLQEWYNNGPDSFRANMRLSFFRHTESDTNNMLSQEKPNTLVSHGDSTQKEYLNRAIKNVWSYISSYKANKTQQDFDYNGDFRIAGDYIVKDGGKLFTDNTSYYVFHKPYYERHPDGYSGTYIPSADCPGPGDNLLSTTTSTEVHGNVQITKTVEHRERLWVVQIEEWWLIFPYLVQYAYKSKYDKTIKTEILIMEDSGSISKRRT